MAVSKKKQPVKETKTIPYGLKVFGITRIFANEVEIKKGKNKGDTFLSYSCSISKKDENGEYKNLYMPIYFSKDLEAPEETILADITEAFFMISGKEGYEKISLYIKDYEEVDKDDF